MLELSITFRFQSPDGVSPSNKDNGTDDWKLPLIAGETMPHKFSNTVAVLTASSSKVTSKSFPAQPNGLTGTPGRSNKTTVVPFGEVKVACKSPIELWSISIVKFTSVIVANAGAETVPVEVAPLGVLSGIDKLGDSSIVSDKFPITPFPKVQGAIKVATGGKGSPQIIFPHSSMAVGAGIVNGPHSPSIGARIAPSSLGVGVFSSFKTTENVQVVPVFPTLGLTSVTLNVTTMTSESAGVEIVESNVPGVGFCSQID